MTQRRRPSFTDIKERRDSLGNVEDFSSLKSLKLPRGEQDSGYDLLLKLLLLGDSGVGKSCFLLRFCDDTFTPSFISTVGIDFKIRTIRLGGKRVKLQVWDTAGQERFRTITNAYYRGAMGVMLVFDVTNHESYESIAKTWLPNIQELAPPEVSLMLIGHKCDAPANSRSVTEQEAKELASHHKMQYCEASSKDDINVDWAFAALTRQVMARIVKEVDVVPTEPPSKVHLSDELDDLTKKQKANTKCCK